MVESSDYVDNFRSVADNKVSFVRVVTAIGASMRPAWALDGHRPIYVANRLFW